MNETEDYEYGDLIDTDGETHAAVARKGPRIPKNAKRPQDHKPPKKSAAQLEAEGVETVDVEWRGLTLTLPADSEDWSAESVLLFERGQNANGLMEILGPTQWAQVMKTKPTKRDLGKLFEEMGEVFGVGD